MKKKTGIVYQSWGFTGEGDPEGQSLGLREKGGGLGGRGKENGKGGDPKKKPGGGRRAIFQSLPRLKNATRL